VSHNGTYVARPREIGFVLQRTKIFVFTDENLLYVGNIAKIFVADDELQ